MAKPDSSIESENSTLPPSRGDAFLSPPDSEADADASADQLPDGGNFALLRAGKAKLSRLERSLIWAIRRSLEPGIVNDTLGWLQRWVGATWISVATSNLRHLHHAERLPSLSTADSFILVCNHRSFFDLYLVSTQLIRVGMRKRLVFPVRANFFYDSILGFVVNGVMSFFAMYPPIFRDSGKRALNVVALAEVAAMIRRGGYLVGLHPEGRRNPGTDPYQLLPAQSGVGRLIFEARVPVIPVFTNGLLHSGLHRQVLSNFIGKGQAVHTVVGEPLDFSRFYREPRSARVFKAISEECLRAMTQLGEEERRLRQVQS